MIAFANTRGGILLVGVGDDKTVPGLKHPEDDAHVINQALATCRPSLEVEEIFVPIDSKRMVIQYEVFESKRKPHYRLNSEGEKESFVRVQDKSIKASREMREIIRRQAEARNIRFAYGDHEHALMKHLDIHPHITLRQYTELTGLKKYIASQKLIRLVLAGVLRILPDERGDLFMMQAQKAG
ncbi:MAG: ATP-binding protein [Bacteroidia bacterium]|nr:ATP-binding protein [Bacteroidia bacterium]